METQSVLEINSTRSPIRKFRLPRMQELGLVFVIVVLGAILSTYGWYDARPGHPNTFLNKDNLIDGIATPMSYYAIMAVGQTFVIITAGIDISVGAIMAVSALGSAALLIRVSPHCSPSMIVLLSVLAPLAIGLIRGLLNGVLIVALDLHPFIVTLGTMSIFRGVANVLPWDTLTNTLDPKTLVLPKATAALMKYQVAGVNIVPGIAMLICVVLGTAASLAIARSRRRWLQVADTIFMSPLLLPALAFGFAALVYINKMGFSPSLTFLIIGHVIVCVPFVLRTTIAALTQLDPALLDASESLGAGAMLTFRRVTLPLIAPGVGAGAFLAFMASFDNVPVSLFLADERTEVLPIHLWQQIDTNLDVRTAAASGLIIAFTLLLMITIERTVGLTARLR